MGGHGGLNILPQKRWNVYGRENRLKVKQDEQKAEAEQAEKDAIHQKAESEYRHSLLLQRAQIRSAAEDTSDAVTTLPDVEALKAAYRLHPRKREESGEEEGPEQQTSQIVVKKPGQALGVPDILGFLQPREAPQGQQHPEVAEEKKQEARRRGDAATQTSDARFDAQFAFGHGLAGAANQPWYAKSLQKEEQEEEGQPKSSESMQLSHSQKDARRKSKHRDKEHRKQKKSEKREKKEKRLRGKDGGVRKAAGLDLITALRVEREAREAAEHDKARQAVLAAARDYDGGPQGKKYHSGFGSKRRRET